MKKYLFLITLLMFYSCETGVENKQTETPPNKAVKSGLNDHSIEELIGEAYHDEEDRNAFDSKLHPIIFNEEAPKKNVKAYINPEDEKKELVYEEVKKVKEIEGGIHSNGLDVARIRKARHETFFRLVFDIQKSEGGKVAKVGKYTAKYDSSRRKMVVTLHGYSNFSAKLPKFSTQNIVETIYLNEYDDNRAYQFTIQLRKDATVKVFALENPARLVMDFRENKDLY